MTTAPGALGTISMRIPASLRPSPRTSLGHLSRMPAAPCPSSARARATPTARLKPPRGRAGGKRHSREKVRLAPGAEYQLRPRRPRPAVWTSAPTTSPEGAP